MNKKQREYIIDILKKGEDIPIEFQEDLFPTTKKEYELKYAGKERKEKILSDTMSVPFQAIKHFGKVKEGEWVNKLIFGDNLQALKHLLKLKNEGKLKNADGTDGVRLVYIDPPFATKQDFQGNQGQKAYSDKIAGSHFIEYLRKRLILIKELLATNGSVFVHLDAKKSHYVKIVLDELFGAQNFTNEIVWHYYNKMQGNINRFASNHEVIFWYSNSSTSIYNKLTEKRDKPVKQIKRIWDKKTSRLVNAKDEAGKVIYIESTEKTVDDVWRLAMLQPAGASEPMVYPTQKPERLISRFVECATNEGDIILDAFAGSGTTGAVAEKLNRRWIMADCGKLAIYTMQKRMMNLKEEIGNKRKALKPKPFVLYNAGLYYDGKLLENMQTDEYKEFVLELFGCQKREHEVSGLEFHGTLNNHSVMVFDKEHSLTEDFVDELHKTVGKSITRECYIIAPAGIVGFGEDYVQKKDVRYIILRIPNSIIAEIQRKNFDRLTQPRMSEDVNQTIDAVGFDFIYPPTVKTKNTVLKPKNKLTEKEYCIEILEFTPKVLGSKVKPLEDPKAEGIAMIMVDFDYDGETFQLDKYWFGQDIVKNEFKITFDDKIGKKAMVIYLDIYGNEKKEVLTNKDFNKG